MVPVVRMLVRSVLTILILSLPAQADPLKLDYQAVMQVRSSHSFPVLDDKNHMIGIAKFRGLAIFGDEQIVLHRYEGWFDLVKGTGKFHGHALWRFDDGSELKAAYDGEAKARPSGGVAVEATLRDFTGTGRFERVTGKGTFVGRRLDDFEHGGSTHVKGNLVLELN